MAKKSKFHELLAVKVAGGTSIKDGAAVVGCSTQTAYNLSADPEFRSRVAELRTEISFNAVGKLTTAATQAIATLIALLDATNEPSIRLNASKAILANLQGLAEFGELRSRIDALEKRTI